MLKILVQRLKVINKIIHYLHLLRQLLEGNVFKIFSLSQIEINRMKQSPLRS